MYERFTDRARKVMQLANQEAQRFNHEYIGTEHILLGILKEGGGVAVDALKQLDVNLRQLRLDTEKLLDHGPDMVTMGKLPQTPGGKKVIEAAIKESTHGHFNYVGTEHFLLGLIRESNARGSNSNSVAGEVLKSHGITLGKVLDTLNDLLFRTPARKIEDVEQVVIDFVVRTSQENPVPPFEQSVVKSIATVADILDGINDKLDALKERMDKQDAEKRGG